MNNSLLEICNTLQAKFSNSADLSVRSLTLNSAQNIKAAVFTIEGMVDKEGLAQSSLNLLLAFDFKNQNS